MACTTGKHATGVLNESRRGAAGLRRGRRRVYDEAAREALIVLWEASARACGKRLQPLLPVLLPALERHGHLRLDARVREQLLAVSAAPIDRLLAAPRAATARRRRRPCAARTFADWEAREPDFVEADLVAHSGASKPGTLVWTLTLTDIASGWTERVVLLVRERSLVVEALDRLRVALPFPLRGIDTDNESELLNHDLITFCAQHDIEFTRSRPYRKNDRLGRAEERRRRPPLDRLWSAGDLRAPLLGVAPVRELLPTVVQTRREDPGRRTRSEALLLARDAVCAAASDGPVVDSPSVRPTAHNQEMKLPVHPKYKTRCLVRNWAPSARPATRP